MSTIATCAIASRTCSGPMPSASLAPTTCDLTPAIDAHTIPIVFGTIGVLLALMAIAVNIAFGVLQLRATDKRCREDHECGSRRTPQSTATTRVRSAHQTGRFAAPTNQTSCFQQKSQQAGTVGMACGASNTLWFVYLLPRNSWRCVLFAMSVDTNDVWLSPVNASSRVHGVGTTAQSRTNGSQVVGRA